MGIQSRLAVTKCLPKMFSGCLLQSPPVYENSTKVLIWRIHSKDRGALCCQLTTGRSSSGLLPLVSQYQEIGIIRLRDQPRGSLGQYDTPTMVPSFGFGYRRVMVNARSGQRTISPTQFSGCRVHVVGTNVGRDHSCTKGLKGRRGFGKRYNHHWLAFTLRNCYTFMKLHGMLEPLS
jgi:hypothetical protein